jgi:hypothetical protein
MVLTAVVFWQVVLAIHIAAVMIAFGVTFAYPLFVVAGARIDPRAMPWFHRVQVVIGRRLISPGLAIVLLAGIYLASKLHQWHAFYVQWGLAVVIVLGAIEGAIIIPREGKLAALAQRDIAASGAGEVSWSSDYDALMKWVRVAGTVMSVLVLITVYLMTVQAGG